MIGLHRIIAVASLVGVAGCATILSGTTQTITLSTNVEGAEVFLDGVQVGTTPFVGPVAKKKEQLRIELDGYRSETVVLSKSLDPVFWANIILGGTIGSITDYVTGAAYQYAPASYQVDLQRTGQSDEDFLHEVLARKFSMIYIDQIALDLGNSGGDYVSALVNILNSNGNGRVAASDIAAAFARSSGYAVHFGREITSLRVGVQ
jgi:hypothetical protein